MPILPSGAKHVITLVDSAREPIEPVGVMGPYKKAIRMLVKDNISIKYRYWHKKDSEWVVPSSLMELCWQKLKDLFEFPARFDEEVTKERALFIMGNSFKYFRYYLNTQYLRKDF